MCQNTENKEQTRSQEVKERVISIVWTTCNDIVWTSIIWINLPFLFLKQSQGYESPAWSSFISDDEFAR